MGYLPEFYFKRFVLSTARINVISKLLTKQINFDLLIKYKHIKRKKTFVVYLYNI
jgi:hypothetical protein